MPAADGGHGHWKRRKNYVHWACEYINPYSGPSSLSGPRCSQLRFEHSGAIFGAGEGLWAVKHADQESVSNNAPAGISSYAYGGAAGGPLQAWGRACGLSLAVRLFGGWRARWCAGRRCGCSSRHTSALLPGRGLCQRRPRWGWGFLEVCVRTIEMLLMAMLF